MDNITPKKPRAKAPRPIESFGPEILAALLRGANEGLEFETSYATAVRFRLRIHQLREAMRKGGHEKYSLVARVRVSVKWRDDEPVEKQGQHNVPINRDAKVLVSLRPNDEEFGSMLKSAGVSIELGEDSHAPHLSPGIQPATTTDLEDLLKGLEP